MFVWNGLFKGANVPSSAALTLPNDGNFHHVTGTTTITSIAESGRGIGAYEVLVFDGVLTLTHGVNLILPNGANRTTAAGEMWMAWQESAGVWRLAPLSLAEFAYLSGVTSNIQTQIDDKATADANQNANLVKAGPASGGAAAPTYRALLNNDMPAIHKAAAVSLTDAATIALDASLGRHFKCSSAVDRTLGAPTNPTPRQTISVTWKNTDSAAHTLTLPIGTAGSYRFGSDISALSATAAGKKDKLVFQYDEDDDRWDVVGYTKGY